MKIILINDFFQQGGAEIQALEELNELKKNGIDAFLITFDFKFRTGLLNEHTFNIRRTNTLFGKFINKFFVNIKSYYFFKKYIVSFKTEYIHLHN